MAEVVVMTAETKEGAVTPPDNDAAAGTVTENQDGFSSVDGANGEGGAVKNEDADTKMRNAENAKRRREAEQAKKIKMAEMNAIKRVLKENPYTHQPIETEADVEEFLIMREIEADNGDPIADYFKRARENRARNQTSVDNISRLEAEIEDFSANNPGINVSDVLNDEGFNEYAEGKLGVGNNTLTKVYKRYQEYLGRVTKAAEDKATRRAAQSLANAQAAVGSLNNSKPNADDGFFTREQVRAMSKEEVKKNYEKIRESQKKW